MRSEDSILKTLSTAIINRNLFKMEFLTEQQVLEKYKLMEDKYNSVELQFLVLKGVAQNNAYNPEKDNIYIRFKDGSIKEITDITEQWNIRSLTNPVIRHYIAYQK